MNRDWICYTTLICQQRIENSMVNKNLWKKSKIQNLLSLLIKKPFTTTNYFRDLYLQNFFSRFFIQ